MTHTGLHLLRRLSAERRAPPLLRKRSSERLRFLEGKAAQRRLAIKKQSEEAARKREVAAQPKARVSKHEVVTLKRIFDELDDDGNGHITLEELRSNLLQPERYDGTERSAQQRKERRSIEESGMHRFADTLIAYCDAGGRGGRDGTIDFDELLRALHPRCSEAEYAAMHRYVAPVEEPPPPTPTELLTRSQHEEVNAIFHLYDLDASGNLSRGEWAAAAAECGLSTAEEQVWFDALAAEAGGAEAGGAAVGLDTFVAFMAESAPRWRAMAQGPDGYLGGDGLRPGRRSARAAALRSPRKRLHALPPLGSATRALVASPGTAAHPLELALDASLRKRTARRASAYTVRTPARAVLLARQAEQQAGQGEEAVLLRLVQEAIAF